MEFKIGDGAGWSADVVAVHPHDKADERFRPGQQPENLRFLVRDLGTVNLNEPCVIRAGLKT
jgi:hypothetical protein